MAYYYFKFMTANINDPVIGTLDNWLWRKYFEMYAIACEFGQDGLLPPLAQMAWGLRVGETEVRTILDALCEPEIGLAVEVVGEKTWKLTRFEKEQGPVNGTERSRKSRQRTCNDDATKRCTSSTSISDSSSGSVSEGVGVQGEGDVFKAYEQNIGLLTPVIGESLGALIDQYTPEWVLTAIENAAKQEKRSLAYVEGTLKGWRRDGLANPKTRTKPAPENREDILRQVAHG